VAQVRATFGALADAGEIDLERTPIGTVRGDALHLPFADGTFDRVICSEVLEHIPDDELAMAELARVLSDDGTMAITVPRFGPELINWALSEEYYDTPGGHVRMYRRSTLLDRLARVGLTPYDRHHAHGLHSPYWWLKCAVGPRNDDNRFVRAYHRLLVWDIVKGPRTTKLAERLLAPLIGKSFVVYLKKAPVPAVREPVA
jgi:SAM-dependent methyltransferase